MSMFVRIVPAWQQLQNWHASQKQLTDQVIGSAATGTAPDYSASFTDAAATFYTGVANLSAQAAAKRLGIKLSSSSGTTASAGAASRSSSSNAKSTASTTDYVKIVNEMANGISGVVASAKAAIASSGSAQAAITNMIYGVKTPAAPQPTAGADGNVLGTIDRIISGLTPSKSVVNVTA